MDVQNFFRETLRLTDPMLIRHLIAITDLRTLRRGEFLIRQEEQPRFVYFLLQGVLRGFLTDEQGREITDCFAYQQGEPAMPSFDISQPSGITIEALADSTLAALPMEEIRRLLQDDPAVKEVYCQLLLEAAKRHWETKNALYQYDAAGRYAWFLRAYPGLIGQVSNKHLASFLGITPVTLSRLRAQRRREQAAGAADGSAPRDGEPGERR
jgi:CRP-like cAMP-binding protein